MFCKSGKIISLLYFFWEQHDDDDDDENDYDDDDIHQVFAVAQYRCSHAGTLKAMLCLRWLVEVKATGANTASVPGSFFLMAL